MSGIEDRNPPAEPDEPAVPAAPADPAAPARKGRAADPYAAADAHPLPDVPRSSRPPHLPRHRLLALLVVVLLIAVPAGYLVLSAFQSRASGEDKARIAAQTNLAWEWPSQVQRRIYDVPLPADASYIAHYETNSWERSTLYAQFRTSDRKLERFLREAGADPEDLRGGPGEGVTAAQAEQVGWNLDDDGKWEGLRLEQPGSAPDLNVTVDRSADQRPRVYVVSTIDF